MPSIKETHFFSDDATYQNGFDEYSHWFCCDSTSIVGEIDPEYLFFPRAAERIAQHAPDARFVIILRNPYDRAYSHYLMTHRRGYEPLAFNDALEAERERLECGGVFEFAHYSYLARSCYATQILRFKDYFPDASVLYVNFDEMVAEERRKDVFLKICRFIGLDDNEVNDAVLSLRFNEAGIPRFSFIRNLLYKESMVKTMLGSVIQSKRVKTMIALWLDTFNTVKAKQKSTYRMADFSPAMRQMLDEQIIEAQRLTGLTLSQWLSGQSIGYGE